MGQAERQTDIQLVQQWLRRMGIKYSLHAGMDQAGRLLNIGWLTQLDEVDTQWTFDGATNG
jgi:hypothetical protein